MPLRISDDVKELTIFHKPSNSDIVLFYRMPTTSEMNDYQNEIVSKKRNKVVFGNMVDIRMKYGQMIMEGVRQGDIEIKVNGEYLPLVTNPGHAQYNPDWKNIIVSKAPELIMALAQFAFEAVIEVDEESKN